MKAVPRMALRWFGHIARKSNSLSHASMADGKKGEEDRGWIESHTAKLTAVTTRIAIE